MDEDGERLVKAEQLVVRRLGEIEHRCYVRVIEDGVVSIKAFGSETEAQSFANSEKRGSEFGPTEKARPHSSRAKRAPKKAQV